MNKQRKTSNILNVFQYDEITGAVTLPSTLVLTAPAGDDNSTKVPTTGWTRSYISSLGYVTGNQSISITGDASGSGTTSINLTLANTAVTPGSYGSATLVPVVTVDSKGRITNVTTASISGALTFVGDVTGSGTTGSNTTLTLANSGVTAGTYTKVTVDSKGRITVGASSTTSDISEGTNLYYTDARVLAYLGANNYATQSFVSTQINNLVSGAPGLLDTLDELAQALGDDPSFATTTATSLGNRLRIDTASQGLNSTQQANGRTNLGLGSAALSATGDFATAAQGTRADTAHGWGNHASAGYLTSAIAATTYLTQSTAASTYVSLTGSYSNPTWITALAYSKLTGVPSTFTPSSHTHAISEVTGLQTALDGKQATLGFTPYNATNPSGYISGNQTISLSGDTSGSGTTSIAVTVNRLTFQGNYANNDVGTTRGPDGLSLRGVYVNGYPTQYGNILHMRGWGSGQLLIGWSGTDGNHTDNYVRSKRDNDSGAWSPWAKVWTDVNLTNLNQLTNGPGYITGYTETDTLASVTGRGNSTSSSLYLTGGTGTIPALHIRSSGSNWSEGLAIHPLTDDTYSLAFFRTKTSFTDATDTWALGNMGETGIINHFALLRRGLSGSSVNNSGNAVYAINPNGTFRFGFNPFVGSNIILHAGNFNSYSPTLGGTGATGTWPISVTGSAGSLSSMNISQFNNNSGYITGINSANVTNALGYTPFNAGSWGGYYHYTLTFTSTSTGTRWRAARVYYNACHWGSYGIMKIRIRSNYYNGGYIEWTISNGPGEASIKTTDHSLRQTGGFNCFLGEPVAQGSHSGCTTFYREVFIEVGTYIAVNVDFTWSANVNIDSNDGGGDSYSNFVIYTGSNRTVSNQASASPIVEYRAPRVTADVLSVNTTDPATNGLVADFNGSIGIRGANTLYFGHSNNNINSWSTKIYASGSTMIHGAQSHVFGNEGYGSTFSTTINSSGITSSSISLNNNATIGRDVYVTGNTGGDFGNRLIVGATSTPYTLQDTNIRPTIYATGAYPVLTLNHTVTGNVEHGPTIQFTFNGSNSRQWVIGCGGSGNFMDFGFSSSGYSNSNFNPHNGISGYLGNTIMRIIDNRVGIGGDWGAYGAIANPTQTLDVRGIAFVSEDVRSPIFYDSNDTSYFVNPNGQSNLLLVNAPNGYVSNGNPWGTSNSAFFPNGITTAGGTNWVYGLTFLGNAPANGSGAEVRANGSSYFRNGNTSGTWGYAGQFVDRNNAANNYVPWSFENEWGNHSWGIVARFHIQASGQDKSAIQFTSTGSNERWSLGYCSGSDFNFRITQNQGFRTDGSGNSDGWGTERFLINTSGNVTASVDMRSPIFYDSNDTAYFINPNSDARLYALVVGYNTSSSPGVFRVAAGHGDTSIRLTAQSLGSGNSPTMQWWVSEPNVTWDNGGFGYNVTNNGDSPGGFGRVNTSWGQAYMRMATGGDWFFYNTNTSGTRTQSLYLSPSGAATFGTDVRAPIYYDSANTGFYVDPNGGSYLASSIEIANGSYLSNGIGGAMYMTTVTSSFGGYLRTSGHMVLDQMNTGYNVYVLDGNSVGVVKNASSQSWSAFSDRTLKTIHSTIEGSLSKLESITPIYYSFNNFADDKNRIGLIAQEVQEHFPELVDIEPMTEKLVLDYTGLIPVLLGAIKELKNKVEVLESQL
jgi:hypothetical protein